MRGRLRRALICIVILAAICGSAFAAIGLWTGTGPFATGTADRHITAIVVSPDGTIYAGTGSGTVFSYSPAPAPAITGITPATGPLTGGIAVTITGTNFHGTTVVKFGATNATNFTVDSGTQITAVSPAGTGGSTVDILITTPRWHQHCNSRRPVLL